jgi:hypothetical protein
MGKIARRRPWLRASIVVGFVLLMAMQAAQGATPAPCRVQNVTQGASGSSLVKMVARATDGDVLLVRGICGRHGTIFVDADITIEGRGRNARLTGAGEHRVLETARGTKVTLRHLTITRGWAHWRHGAGGILSRGDLTVEDSTIRRNVESGIAHTIGLLLLRRVVVEGNQTRFSGGGISAAGGRARLVDTVVRHNIAEQGEGGGIFNSNWAFLPGRGPMTLVRSRVVRNSTGYRGGGISNWGTLRLVDSTVSDNTASDRAGGLYNDINESVGSVILKGSSSVTGNTPDDCVGTPAC